MLHNSILVVLEKQSDRYQSLHSQFDPKETYSQHTILDPCSCKSDAVYSHKSYDNDHLPNPV